MFLLNSYRFGRNRRPLPFARSSGNWPFSFSARIPDWLNMDNAMQAYRVYKRLRSEL
jgi:hypothetical protein